LLDFYRHVVGADIDENVVFGSDQKAYIAPQQSLEEDFLNEPVAFEVGNLEEKIRELEGSDARKTLGIIRVGNYSFASFVDPDGNPFELVQKKKE